MENQQRQKHLFLIHTEFHLLMLLSIIENNFNLQDTFTVVLSRKSASNRFKFNLNLAGSNFKMVELLDIDEKKAFIPPQAKQQINKLLSTNYDQYYSFLEHTGLNYLFVSSLSSDTKICLLPEGTRPYITFSKAAFGSRLKQTINNYRFLFKTGYPWYKIRVMNYKHGYLPETDEIWIENPETYPNYNNKKLNKIFIFNGKNQSFKPHKELFDFDINNELNNTKDVILYLNHWFVVHKVYVFEINVLKQIRKKFPKKEIIIKLHPNTPKFQIDQFNTIENISLNTSTKPAELFIEGIKSSTIISFWSASLMIPNKSCDYYWLYPLVLKNIPEMYWWSMNNPTNHVKSIENISDIE